MPINIDVTKAILYIVLAVIVIAIIVYLVAPLIYGPHPVVVSRFLDSFPILSGAGNPNLS